VCASYIFRKLIILEGSGMEASVTDKRGTSNDSLMKDFDFSKLLLEVDTRTKVVKDDLEPAGKMSWQQIRCAALR
jgi:hypothetical protein